jgi:hypothetical protein
MNDDDTIPVIVVTKWWRTRGLVRYHKANRVPGHPLWATVDRHVFTRDQWFRTEAEARSMLYDLKRREISLLKKKLAALQAIDIVFVKMVTRQS